MLARYLFPRLVRFVVDVQDVPDPEGVRGTVAGALVGFAATVEGEKVRMAVLCVLVPMLLTRAAAAAGAAAGGNGDGDDQANSTAPEQERKRIFAETAKRLLELAGEKSLTPIFRGVVRKMSASQREFMEKVIREGGAAAAGGRRGQQGGGGEGDGEGDKGEPSIALKMNFG